MPHITITIDIEVVHVEGRFVSGDDLASVIGDGVDDAIEALGSGLDACGDTGESVYDITNRSHEVELIKPARRKKATT